jgi:type I restriction enzyme M protein
MAIVVPNGILNNPALAYVRRWLLTHTQILAVVDIARELFQPRNDTQTSMVLLRRLADDEVAGASSGGLDYPIFMAVGENVGHDRRGNALHRRDDTGDDVLVTRSDTVAEIDPASGFEVFKTVELKERLVDEDLPEVALAYRRWLSEAK